jgi:hypothetical protein
MRAAPRDKVTFYVLLLTLLALAFVVPDVILARK